MATINGAFVGNVSFQDFLLFLFVIIFTFILGAILDRLVVRLLRERVRPVIYKSVSKIVMYGVYVFGFYFAFQRIINFNLPAGLAALGILGIALLLPTVPILQNLAAGIVIALERPFREEDIVEINNVICKVKNIGLRKTKFRTLDGKILYIPNLVFMTSASIINFSKGEFIKVVLSIDVTLDSDRNKAIGIIEKICNDNPNILPNIPEKKLNRIKKIFEIPKNFFIIPRNIKSLNPQVTIKYVDKEKISLEVWFWIWNILMKEKIVSAFYEKLIEEFNKEGIKFG